MISLNSNYLQLEPSYLFPEMKRRVVEFASKHMSTPIYNLGEGDTTRPLTTMVSKAMSDKIKKMNESKDYMGYSDPIGQLKLKKTISDHYRKRLRINIIESDIFVSDGAKSDLFNIQTIFNNNIKIALQSPSYPVYIDSLVINGKAGNKNTNGYKNILLLKGVPENGFVPSIPKSRVDLIYLCFPNNPTGSVATKEKLTEFVEYANENNAIIIFDAVYSWFIHADDFPESIYQIPGAEKCAIEVQSFSKLAGFPSVRLGWTVVPFELTCKNIEKGRANALWKRRQQTGFNGASVIVQAGGVAALSNKGLQENKRNIDYYLDNVSLIKETCDQLGLSSFGGKNAPYVWVKIPDKKKSWEYFSFLLQKTGIVCTPGIGFGEAGEGYFRLSGFAGKEDTDKAMENFKKVYS